MAAPTVILQTIHEDENNIMVKIVIPSGGDADVSLVNVLDVSTFTVGRTVTQLGIHHLFASLDNLAVRLYWDATTDVEFYHIGAYSNLAREAIDSEYGTIRNNAGTGVTGDILLSTRGISGTNSVGGTVIIHAVKLY